MSGFDEGERQELAKAVVVASPRASGKTRRLVDAILDGANKRGLEVRVIEASMEQRQPITWEQRKALFEALRDLQVVSLDQLHLIVQAVIEAGWTPPEEAEDGR